MTGPTFLFRLMFVKYRFTYVMQEKGQEGVNFMELGKVNIMSVQQTKVKGLQRQCAKRWLQSFHNDEDGRINATGDILTGEMNSRHATISWEKSVFFQRKSVSIRILHLCIDVSGNIFTRFISRCSYAKQSRHCVVKIDSQQQRTNIGA